MGQSRRSRAGLCADPAHLRTGWLKGLARQEEPFDRRVPRHLPGSWDQGVATT
jgi:hypothetical protein